MGPFGLCEMFLWLKSFVLWGESLFLFFYGFAVLRIYRSLRVSLMGRLVLVLDKAVLWLIMRLCSTRCSTYEKNKLVFSRFLCLIPDIDGFVFFLISWMWRLLNFWWMIAVSETRTSGSNLVKLSSLCLIWVLFQFSMRMMLSAPEELLIRFVYSHFIPFELPLRCLNLVV